MYEPRIGDVVLLSTFMPRDFKDLQKCISLGVVTKRSGDGRHCEGKLGTSSRIFFSGGALHVAVYLTSITNISNVWNSLNVDIDDPHISLNLIRKALCRQSLVNKSNPSTSSQVEDILHGEVTSKLNESQIDAVRSVVSDITSNHSECIHCISGLPGAGKSEIACIIALAALILRLKVIVCLPSNYIVGDIAAHFEKIVEGSHVKCNKEDIAVYGDSNAEQSNSYGELCLENSRLIFCSVSWLQSMKKIGSVGVLIIDNAFEIKECDTIIPFQLKGLRHVILIGNAHGLPAPTKSKISEDVGFARSLFERLGSYCPPKKHLDIQYRMHPEISYFPSTRFFNGLLSNALNMDSSHFRRLLPEHIYKAYSFLDVADGKEAMNDHENDWRNVVEAAVVVKILTKLYHGHVNSGGKLSIGVLSPYKAQVQTIQDMLSERFESNSQFSIWVRSLDGIRSDEVDVIIISTVRCSGSGSVISDQYITGLSLTRARHCLWIVGSRTTLCKSRSIWQDLVHDAGKRGCIFHVGEDKDLAKVVLDVKHELDELNDLLDMESVLFHDKKWKVIFSDDFKQSFVALKSLFIKQIVLGFLLRLANGWRPKHRCVYSLKPSMHKFVKLYRVNGIYLICTIDIDNDAEFTQVLRIWDVVPLVEIPKLVAKLEEMTSVCSDYYMERCMKEKHEGNMVVPMSWNLCSDFIKYNYPPGHCSGSGKSINLERSKVSESLLLMKFYSLSSVSVKSLLKACNGNEIELPFEVNDVELEIIRYPRSSFILGRSGTGKTIISIMKLMQREQVNIEAVHGVIPNTHHNKMWENHALAGNSLRQIFVTVSANLCSVVKDYITRLRRCVSGLDIQGDIHVNAMREVGDWLSIFSDIPDSFIDIPERHFPLVTSLHKFLLMLDGSLSCSYFNRFRDIMAISDGKGSTMSRAKQQLILGKEVRFKKFLTSYWPSFNDRYTRKLDPQLVFSQIISFIKGGCRLGKADWKEKLDEEAYVRLSESRKSTISEKKRHMIYQIFLNYEKKKRQNGEYDISDLVLHIHSQLRHEGYSGAMMDFVYIDEVQDFTLNQLLLFKYVCANVKDGFVFSGDTAQTITKGVDFRFQDIRSLFYTDFLDRSERSPDFFKLKQNFRTHAAILKLGQSVLSLLYHFFPLSVDKLESETSLLQGEVPVLVHTCDDNVLKNIFRSNIDDKDGMITFGAQQVILVRDDLVKELVIEQVGNNALVLTIIECKGLEFQDVLLYNFFEKSSLRETWEVVYDFMAGENILDPLSHRYPLFDEDRHSALCGELKELYVAITRPRERLWIFERT
ncbi:UvrD-like Helicase, ATP-binding domain, P-loop containing nucleoside triphosphate hydrolase, partial [Thalictrum thalictroides]